MSPGAGRLAAVVAGPIERVFDTVAEIHAAARDVARDPADDLRGAVLAGRVRELLGSAGQLAVGLGLVVAPGPQRELQLRWWQTDPATGRSCRHRGPAASPPGHAGAGRRGRRAG